MGISKPTLFPKMNKEKFCLHWNDFEKNISEAFKDLQNDDDLFDVTLACDDEQIKAHKLILSACSPFFRNIFKRNPHQHPLVYLKGVKYADLQCVLAFMYQGEVSVAQENLNCFLAVAEELRVKGLTQNNKDTETNEKKENHDKHTNYSTTNSNLQETLEKATPISKRGDHRDIEEVTNIKSEPENLPLNKTTSNSQTLEQKQCDSHDKHPNNAVTVVEDDYVTYDDTYEHYDDDPGYQRGSDNWLPNSHLKSQSAGPDIQDPSDLLQFVRKDPSDQKFYCSLCENFSHKVISHARNHVESKHYPDFFTYSCDQCGDTFTTKTNLNAHRTRKHRQDKPKFHWFE